MAINVSVHHNGGFLPGIILLRVGCMVLEANNKNPLQCERMLTFRRYTEERRLGTNLW